MAKIGRSTRAKYAKAIARQHSTQLAKSPSRVTRKGSYTYMPQSNVQLDWFWWFRYLGNTSRQRRFLPSSKRRLWGLSWVTNHLQCWIEKHGVFQSRSVLDAL